MSGQSVLQLVDRGITTLAQKVRKGQQTGEVAVKTKKTDGHYVGFHLDEETLAAIDRLCEKQLISCTRTEMIRTALKLGIEEVKKVVENA